MPNGHKIISWVTHSCKWSRYKAWSLGILSHFKGVLAFLGGGSGCPGLNVLRFNWQNLCIKSIQSWTDGDLPMLLPTLPSLQLYKPNWNSSLTFATNQLRTPRPLLPLIRSVSTLPTLMLSHYPRHHLWRLHWTTYTAYNIGFPIPYHRSQPYHSLPC